MNVLFLNAALLAGMVALAIPIVLHFFFRGRKRRLRFSTLRFFVEEQTQQVSRRKVKNILLMLVRLILLTLIVVAFARPYLNNSGAEGNQSTSNVVLVVDLTASMRRGLASGTWAAGQATMKELLESLSASDRVAVVACGTGAHVLVDWGEKVAALEALDSLSPGYGAAPISSGLELAVNLLKQPQLPLDARDSIHVFSDFQEVGLKNLSKVSVSEQVNLSLHSVQQLTSANLSVSVDADTRSFPLTATVEVKNRSEIPMSTVLTVAVDGKPGKAIPVKLDAWDRQWIERPLVDLDYGWHELVAKISPGDDADYDDVFYGSFKRASPFKVVCLSQSRILNLHDSLFFLKLALDPGLGSDAPHESPFELEFLAPSLLMGRLSKDLAEEIDMIVIPASRNPLPEMGEFLRQYVEGGGGVLFFSGPEIWASTYNREFGPVLPVQFGKCIVSDDHRMRPNHIGDYLKDHPVFRLFAESDAGDLAKPSFSAWNELIANPEAAVLARFDNGVPLLVEQRHGAGRVIILNTSVGDEWSNWPKRRTYLPVIQEIGLYLCGETQEVWPLAFEVGGAPIQAVVGGSSKPARAHVSAVDDAAAREPASSETDPLFFYRPGIHDVERDPVQMLPVAVNPDTQESETHFLEPRRVETLVARDPVAMRGAEGQRTWAFDRREAWRWLMGMGALMLVVELLISNRFAVG